MDEEKLFPETIHFSFKCNVKSQAIYITFIVMIISIIGLSPFIKINLSFASRGIVRPVKEKTEIRCLTGSKVTEVLVHEGEYIAEGDTIMLLDADKLSFQLRACNNRRKMYEKFIYDIEKILDTKDTVNLCSRFYQEENRKYLLKLHALDKKIYLSNKELEKYKKLYNLRLIAEKEYDEKRFKHTQLLADKQLFIRDQKSKWEYDYFKFKIEIDQCDSKYKQIKSEYDNHIIKAPVSGTIEEFRGIFTGSRIYGGQVVAVISPLSDLITEVYIAPKDIGHITKDMPVKIQVDAYNYNEWGVLNAKIIDVSNDFVMINNSPMFIVKCRPEKNLLELKNGVKGHLKKGMSVNARFQIARRSLFQLFYQKGRDWFKSSDKSLS